jgi:hypothetical protein
MNTAFVTYGVLAVLSIGAAAVFLARIKSTLYVGLVAATIAAVIFQVIVYAQLGYFDPFALVAFAVSWAYSLAVALVFVGTFRKFRPPKVPGAS